MSKSVMLLTGIFSLTALAGPTVAPAAKINPQMVCVCNGGGCSCVLVEISESGNAVY